MPWFCILALSFYIGYPIAYAEQGPLFKANNSKLMQAFSTFTDVGNIGVESFGDSSVRLHLTKGVSISKRTAKQLVGLGEQALSTLEQWTGKQNVFLPRSPAEHDSYCIVILKNARQFNDMIAFFRKKGVDAVPERGEDLVLAYKKLHGIRCIFITQEELKPVEKYWTCHSIASMALTAYYAERGRQVPTWILVSVCSDIQQLLCRHVAIHIVQYQRNNSMGKTAKPWNKDVARIIKDKKTSALSADLAMKVSLVGTSYNHYIQLRSIGSFIRTLSSTGNGYANILRRTARGEPSLAVVMDVMSMPNKESFTNAWHSWAVKQK